MYINKQISEKILTIGPDSRNHRGGIGAVIDIYSKNFEVFNFIPTYKVGPTLYKIYVFLKSLFNVLYILLRNKNIEIVHIHGSHGGSFYRKYICFVISKYLFNKKVLYHVHSSDYHLFYANSNRLIRSKIRKFINHADCLVCLSDWWKKFFEENFNPNKIATLANVIDYPIITEKHRDSEITRFLFLGIIDHRKGVYDLIEVIKNNMVFFENKIELIIGGNGETEKLQNLIKKYQIGHVVKFSGWIQKEQKIQYLQNTDIYILPSYNEGLPISILEAMSYGKPIISTYVGGIPEIVRNNENGFLISPGNLDQIEKSIKYFIEKPHDIEKFGSVSAKMVEKYFPDSVFLNLERIYLEILTG